MAEFSVKDAAGADVLIGSFWVPNFVLGAFTPGVAYSEGKCIGGKFNVALGHANTNYSLQLASLSILGMTAGIGVDVMVFDEDPTTSTLNDGALAVVTAADLPKLAYRGFVSAQPSLYAGVPSTFDAWPRRMVNTDAAGNLYLAFVSAGAIAITTPKAEWRVEARN